MSSTLVSASVALVSAVGVSVISHLLLVRRTKRESRLLYRGKLYSKQLEAYQTLWSLLRPTSNVGDAACLLLKSGNEIFLGAETSNAFCSSMVDFFFSANGILLASPTRKSMFRTIHTLRALLPKDDTQPSVLLSDEDATTLRKRFADLQATIRRDVSLVNVEFPGGYSDVVEE